MLSEKYTLAKSPWGGGGGVYGSSRSTSAHIWISMTLRLRRWSAPGTNGFRRSGLSCHCNICLGRSITWISSADMLCSLTTKTKTRNFFISLLTAGVLTNSDFLTDQTFHQFHDLYTELDLHRIMSGFHGAFATGVASQQGTLTLPDTWFRPPFWDLLMLQLLRPNSSNLPCLYSTFHL